MTESTHPPRPTEIAAWILCGITLLALLPLHLLPALLAGLLVYQLVQALTPLLACALPNHTVKPVAVGLLAAVVVGALLGTIIGVTHVLRHEVSSIAELFAKLAALLDDIRRVAPASLLSYVPADAVALEAAVSKWLRVHAAQLQGAGTAFGRGLVKTLIGMIIGAMVALYKARSTQEIGPLAQALCERIQRISHAFRRVVFAQVRISAINTVFTALFLMVILPLCGIHLPLTKTMVAITFFAGLLPVIGNLISNTLITFVSLSVSFYVGVAALTFLIVIHKLEYFLNARIVGGQINARAWELLIAMLLFESAFGISGLVAAPIYYAYLKDELVSRNLI